MSITEQIPKEVINTIKALEDKGFEAFLVGGCVRDLFLNKEPKDWDVTTNANPEEIVSIFPDSFYENDFGTVGVKTDSEDPKLKIIEVTPYRKEDKYSDHRHPDSVVWAEKIDDDLQRRDFTINAIAYSPSKGQIIDLYKGQEDIKNKVIKAVGEASSRFTEDALRMLRAVRFSAELGFSIESDTLGAIMFHKKHLKDVSRERVRDEFVKIINSDNPMLGLAVCQKIGILQYISPILEVMVGVDQNKEAHLYDVWEHSLRSLQHAADKKYSTEIRLAALFHDIAKPHTKRTENGKTTFYGHDVVGARVTREIMEGLMFPSETVKIVTKLVRWHMFFSDTETITLSAVRRLIQNVGTDHIWDLMNLRICDRIGTGRPKEEPYRLRKFQSMIEEVIHDPISVSMLKVDGNTLINTFHVEPGPKIGDILHILLEDVLEDPKLNNEDYLNTRIAELLAMDEKDLEKLGKEAKSTKDEAEGEELKKIRGKYHVK